MTRESDKELEEIRLDLEYLDGMLKAYLVALRALLRNDPTANANIRRFLSGSNMEAYKPPLSGEQKKGLSQTLQMLIEPPRDRT